MTLLVLGILLWSAAHLLRRVAPGVRAMLTRALPPGADRGVIALVLVIGLVLIIAGYWQAGYVSLYSPPPWAWHVNNILMFFAIVLFGMGKSRGSMRAWLRHPMLTGVVVWGGAHLLVNGDLASVVLFGSMVAWAVAEMAAINAATGPWKRPEPGPFARNFVLLFVAAVLYGLIAALHILLGSNPFSGSF